MFISYMHIDRQIFGYEAFGIKKSDVGELVEIHQSLLEGALLNERSMELLNRCTDILARPYEVESKVL